MICVVYTKLRRSPRFPGDDLRHSFDAVCDQHGVVSPGWTTESGALIAAEQHQATADLSSTVTS